jgi:hypothetical protein
MNFMKATVLIAAAAAVAVAGDHVFGASPFYAPYSPAPVTVPASAAAPYGYTTYCTQNGCYRVPVTSPGTSYVTPASGNTVNGYPAGSPCANGACSVGSKTVTPRTAPIVRPNPPARTMPMTPAPGRQITGPSTAPKYFAPQSSPFYSSGTAGPSNPAAGTHGLFMPSASTKAPSQTMALAGNRPSPFYP